MQKCWQNRAKFGQKSGLIRGKFSDDFFFFFFFFLSKYVVENVRSLHVPLFRYWNRRQNKFGAPKKSARVKICCWDFKNLHVPLLGGPRKFIQPKRGQATDLIGSWYGPWTSQKCIAAGSHRWPSAKITECMTSLPVGLFENFETVCGEASLIRCPYHHL